MSDRAKPGTDAERDEDTTDDRRANAASDAVKDPNEKTDGKPGDPSGGQGGETDPGGG